MTITEANRHQLHQALITALGEEEAATLMEHLPPVGWADVATKTDLDHLSAVLDSRFDAIHARFGAVDSRLDAIEARFDARFGAVDARFGVMEAMFDTKIADLRTEMADQFRNAQRWQLTALVCVTTIITAVLGTLITVT